MKEHMLQELERIVRCAGDMVREAHDIEQVTTEKNGAADLVTKYDVAVQGFLKVPFSEVVTPLVVPSTRTATPTSGC